MVIGNPALEFCVAAVLCTLIALWLVMQRCWLDARRMAFVDANDLTVAAAGESWIVTRRGHFLALHADLRIALDMASERLLNNDPEVA